METIRVDGLMLCFDPADADSAGLVADACRRTLNLLRDRYSLEPPADCRVYIMTSWRQFLFQASPWAWKLLFTATIPIWMFRIGRMWPYVGGWEMRFGRRHTIGVKPTRLLEAADKSIGNRIFLPVEDPRIKLQHLTCHELTHAVTDRLNLPGWLKEGVAMRMVDHYAGAATVRPDTLLLLDSSAPQGAGRGARWEETIQIYARGYWLMRLIEDTHPEILKRLLAESLPARRIEQIFREAFSIPAGDFWRGITPVIRIHFSNLTRPPTQAPLPDPGQRQSG